jgi:sulfate transport system ATP-binding protein
VSIEIRGVTKTFGAYTALRDVSIELAGGGLVALLGPSGSGKTTLLRIIAGLEVPDAGVVLFDGADATRRHARHRGVGFVFQHYALFRHMTVFENVAFGLRVRPRRDRLPGPAITQRVHDLLGLVQMDGLAHRYPSQLSGGQRQRIALARALAIEPKVLLLDEPFGALDARVRQELRRWLRRLHAEIHLTSAFVTHDVDEALEVADRVVVLNHGRIEQVGTPQAIYAAPANPFVYHFLGSVNTFHGRVDRGLARIDEFQAEAPELAQVSDSRATAYARPHEIEIERQRDGRAAAEARVRHILPIGPIVRVELERSDRDVIEAELTQERYRALALRVGESVFVRPRTLRVFVTPPAEEEDAP